MKIAKTIRKNLLTLAYAYAEATGKSITDVSREIYGRGGFVKGFEDNKSSISIDKLERVIAKFRREWPRRKKFPVLDPIFMDGK
jgi:ribosome maturation factor RimP